MFVVSGFCRWVNTEIVTLHRCVFECGGGGEYGGAGLLVGFGIAIMLLLRWVLLGEACGCKSVVLRACAIRFLWWIFGAGAGDSWVSMPFTCRWAS